MHLFEIVSRPRLSLVALFIHVTLLHAGLSYADKSFTSFLSDTLVRTDQVQTVLEHQPVRHASCKNAVVSQLVSLSNMSHYPLS